MRIGKKTIIIHRNINQVAIDLKKLCGNRELGDNKNNMEIFHGKIDNKYLEFDCEYCVHRLAVPKLKGELTEIDDGNTLIKLNIFAPFTHLIINFLWLIFAIGIIYIYIIPRWSENNIYFNIISIIVMFFYIILDISYYLYHLNNIIEDFILYEEGYYDKYIK